MYLWRAGVRERVTEEWGSGPGFEGFLGVFDDGVELLLGGLWDLAEEFLGDWVSDWESFLTGGFNELSVDEVLVDTGEGILVEASEEWHFQLLIKFR